MIRSTVAAFVAVSGLLVLLGSPVTAREAQTCVGRCDRMYNNCLKNSQSDRDRAECPFERYACEQACDGKPK